VLYKRITFYFCNKTNEISQIYFWYRTLRVSDSFSVHHQESSTIHTAIGICHTGYADCLLVSSQHNLYVVLCVQCYTPDDEQRNCPKHVEFYTKNKFEKLVHLVGFIIRVYHDARSSECHVPAKSVSDIRRKTGCYALWSYLLNRPRSVTPPISCSSSYRRVNHCHRYSIFNNLEVN
jgi:hypothetical protein